MSTNRIGVLLGILKGLAVAIGFTLLGMLIIAALAVFVRIPDHILMLLNQLLKLAAILLGTRSAVGRGGSRGLATGATLALLYMVAGYALYVLLGGGAFSTVDMLGEILIGVAVGSIFGAILANLQPRSKHRRTRAA